MEDFNCVRGTRTQPLICVGCSVQYWMSCAINKGGSLEFAFVSTHMCLGWRRLFTIVNSCGDSCVLGVHLLNVC